MSAITNSSISKTSQAAATSHQEHGISLLEMALILIPLLIFIIGAIGFIDFIRVSHIISRTQDENLRSLRGRPYHFENGGLVYGRAAVDQSISQIVASTFMALGSQICGTDELCKTGVSVEGAMQEISIDPHSGAVKDFQTVPALPDWQKGSNQNFDFESAFASFRSKTKVLGVPMGNVGAGYLPTANVVALLVSFKYQTNSLTQNAFSLVGAGEAKQQSCQTTLLRGEIE